MELCQRLLDLLPLYFTLWITYVAPNPVVIAEDFRVPEIERCAYVNAYHAKCWWKRPKGDTATIYKLGYLTASDPIHNSRDKYCQATQQTIRDGVTTESCAIESTMFQRFTFWVGSVRDCNVTGRCCSTTQRSKDVVFTCTKENVKLTIPPESLNIDPEAKRLTWEPPNQINSMLDFVLRIGTRKAMYRVELRGIGDESQANWEEMYQGYDTSTFLPTLIPGISYEVRIFASLDPPSSMHGRTRPSVAAGVREWTEPSNILVFMVPKLMKVITEEVHVRNREVIEAFQSLDKVNSTTVHGDVILTFEDLPRKIIVVTTATFFVVVLFMAVVVYLAPWQRCCCKLAETKSLKPKTFVDLGGDAETKTQRKDSNISLNLRSGREKVLLITEVNLDFLQNAPSRKITNEDNFTSRLVQGSKALDHGQQLFSVPEPDVGDGSSSDDQTNRSDDVTKKLEPTTTKQDIGSSLADDRAGVKYGSVRYVKFGRDVQQFEMPNYLTASETSGNTVEPSPGEKFSEEYIVEDIENGSSFTNVLGRATEIVPLKDYGKEKQKQWKKHLALIDDEKATDYIPDYVSHAPASEIDFAQNMATFVSMAAKNRPLTSTENSVKISHGKKKILDHAVGTAVPRTKDSSSHYNKNESKRRSSPSTSWQSCKSSRKHENDNEKGENQTMCHQTRPRTTYLLDSSHNLYSLGCGSPSFFNRNNRHSRAVDDRTSFGSIEPEDSDNEADYVTYVVT